MNTVTVTIQRNRIFDGLVKASQQNNKTVEDLATEILESEGEKYADMFRVGMITSAGFIDRITPSEFGLIKEAAIQIRDVSDVVQQLVEEPWVTLDDERLVQGLSVLVGYSLITPERIPQLVAYERP